MYIGGNKKSTFDYCRKHNIPHIFANLQKQKDIIDVRSVYTVHGIEIAIQKLMQ